MTPTSLTRAPSSPAPLLALLLFLGSCSRTPTPISAESEAKKPTAPEDAKKADPEPTATFASALHPPSSDEQCFQCRSAQEACLNACRVPWAQRCEGPKSNPDCMAKAEAEAKAAHDECVKKCADCTDRCVHQDSRGDAAPSAAPLALIPFYVEPAGGSGAEICDNPAYNLLLQSKLVRRALVVINPESGPISPNSARGRLWVDCARRLRKAGAGTLGYVSSKLTIKSIQDGRTVFTQYDLRPLVDIKKAIDQWKEYGEDIDGIFVDEATNVADPTFPQKARADHPKNHPIHVDHYRKIADHVRTTDGSWKLWLNSGGAIRTEYLLESPPAGDGALVFEQGLGAWQTKCGPSKSGPWCGYKGAGDGHGPLLDAIARKQVSPGQLAAAIYDVKASDVATIVSQARTAGVGLIYVTDAKGDPWNNPPSKALLDALAQALEER